MILKRKHCTNSVYFLIIALYWLYHFLIFFNKNFIAVMAAVSDTKAIQLRRMQHHDQCDGH
jgi:hypothetical protein